MSAGSYEVLAAGCQVGIARPQPGHVSCGHNGRIRGQGDIENEGSSGDVDENKEGQVSGFWFQVSGVACEVLTVARCVIGPANGAK